MATHRRGTSAAQWLVADLLRREGRAWPTISPAARGLAELCAANAAPCLLRARPALGAQPLHRLLAVEHLVHKAIEVVRVRHLLRALFARQRAGISEHAPFQPFVGRVLHAFFSTSIIYC